MSRFILLVEDNASDEKLTMLAFKRAGVTNEVRVARDGAEALACLVGFAGSEPALPSVVLLDLKMPRVDGLEVLRRLRANDRTRWVPVVILTSSRQDEDMVRSYALGANAYVRKPVDFSEFVEATRTLARFWLTLNEEAPAGAVVP